MSANKKKQLRVKWEMNDQDKEIIWVLWKDIDINITGERIL